VGGEELEEHMHGQDPRLWVQGFRLQQEGPEDDEANVTVHLLLCLHKPRQPQQQDGAS
jgi:hypothetical protein